MKANFVVLLIVETIFFRFLHSQEFIDVKKLPRPDSGNAYFDAFNNRSDKLFIIPDEVSDSVKFNQITKFFKQLYTPKRETELTETDLKKPLYIYGPINEFKSWEKFNTPIKQVKGGFKFNDVEYLGRNDGISYLTPIRRVFTGNSLSPIWQLQRTPSGSYEYIIIRNGTLSLERIPGKVEIDLEQIRSTNYAKMSSNYFDLFVSKKLTWQFPFDSIVISICQTMNIDLPKSKIIAYVHSDANSARLFSNSFMMFGLDILPDSVTFGTSQFSNIHSIGVNVGILEHESFHIIWEEQIGLSLNAFFFEGIETYYELIRDSSKISRALEIARKYYDYDISKLLLTGEGFWSGPSENNWPVAYSLSGLFAKYLIDKWGLEKFKEYYIIDNAEIGFRKIYHMSTNEIIQGYKIFIKQ